MSGVISRGRVIAKCKGLYLGGRVRVDIGASHDLPGIRPGCAGAHART